MRHTSIDMSLLPSPTRPGYCILTVKRIDIIDGKWQEVIRLIDTEIMLDTKDIPESDIPWFAVDALQDGIRRFAAECSHNDFVRTTFTYPDPE